MVVLESLLAVFAYTASILATLRAGSRMLYLVDKNQIGVMDGPLILGPDDAVAHKIDGVEVEIDSMLSPLWEISFGFQRSVMLGLGNNDAYKKDSVIQYEILSVMESKEDETTPQHKDPYSLSPYPPSRNKLSGGDDRFDIDTDIIVESNDVEKNEFGCTEEVDASVDQNVLSRAREDAKEPGSFLRNLQKISWSPSVINTSISSWARRTWSRTGRLDQDNEDDSWIGGNEVDEEDWEYATHLSSDISYNAENETDHLARVSAFAPKVFSDLRSRFGIAESDFRRSLFDSGPFVSFQSNSKGAARAGGLFFFTRDGAYMIKSIKKEEAQTFLSMLPKYHKFMKKYGRRSLLTRFCGMYEVILSNKGSSQESLKNKVFPEKDEEHVFVVMNSVYPAEASQFVSERFDLKGSTVGRECSVEEKEQKGSSAVLKDLDLAKEVEVVRSIPTSSPSSSEYGLHLGATAKAALLSQLRRDVSLLIACGVMDYSLLVGVVNLDTSYADAASMRSSELREQYELHAMKERQRQQGKRKVDRFILSSIATPIRIMGAPLILFSRRAISMLENTLSSISTWPLPYYGASICGVDGGVLSVMQGKRNGQKAIFYFGVIDFLQPWTARKVVERQLKGVLGYDTTAISCVDPENYASRFLEFVAANVS